MMGESRTRGHSLSTNGRAFKTEVRKNVFNQRVVNLWNSQPQRAVESKSPNGFKRELDRALGAGGIRGYVEKAGTGY